MTLSLASVSVPGSPAVVAGCVIVGSEDGSVYAFGPDKKEARP